MKVLSTLFTIIIVVIGFGLKFARLQRAMDGKPSTSFDVGYDAGVAANTDDWFFESTESESDSAASDASYSSGIQGNPFVQ